MKIKYVAFDSFGVKSMCTFVRTNDISITIDPGIAWETSSFPLPFFKKEELDFKYSNEIKRACRNSDVIVITHYHYDHFSPNNPFLYKDKLLLLKDPNKDLNKSQRHRGNDFLMSIKNKVKKLEIADNRCFVFGKTKIRFSSPVWHGAKNTGLGFVLMVVIDDGKEKLLFTSDLNGIYTEEYVDLISNEKPDYIIFDGAPTYLLGYVMSFKNLELCVRNTIRLLENTASRLYVIDHHLLRDYRYKELYYEVFKRARELGKKLLTAAEAVGKEPAVIEAYKKYGPTKWKEWERMTWARFRKIKKKIK